MKAKALAKLSISELEARRQTKFAMRKLNDENFNEFPPKVLPDSRCVTFLTN